jgi:hypothetical protein
MTRAVGFRLAVGGYLRWKVLHTPHLPHSPRYILLWVGAAVLDAGGGVQVGREVRYQIVTVIIGRWMMPSESEGSTREKSWPVQVAAGTTAGGNNDTIHDGIEEKGFNLGSTKVETIRVEQTRLPSYSRVALTSGTAFIQGYCQSRSRGWSLQRTVSMYQGHRGSNDEKSEGVRA